MHCSKQSKKAVPTNPNNFTSQLRLDEYKRIVSMTQTPKSPPPKESSMCHSFIPGFLFLKYRPSQCRPRFFPYSTLGKGHPHSRMQRVQSHKLASQATTTTTRTHEVCLLSIHAVAKRRTAGAGMHDTFDQETFFYREGYLIHSLIKC